MKAVGYKGRHKGCIEILKAKAAIVFGFCMNKARREEESQRKRRGKATMKGSVTVDYCLVIFTEGVLTD